MTWSQLLEHWALVEVDLHEQYGVDIGAPGFLRTRTWRWLRTRVFGLLSTECRTQRALNPADDPDDKKARR